MNIRLQHFLLCCMLLVCHPAKSQDHNLTNNERIVGWSSDIDTLLSLVSREHYVYRTQPLPAKMTEGAENLKKHIGVYSDERILLELEKLMFYLQDGHSYILPVTPKFNSLYLPLQFYIFSDGVYILDANDPYRELIGYQVKRINGVDIGKLIDDMQHYIHQDNKFTVTWFAPSILRFQGTYEPYGLSPDAKDIVIDMADRQNKPITKNVQFIPASDFHGIPKLFSSKLKTGRDVPMYLKNVDDNFWLQNFADKRILYFQFNQVEDKENESLASFSQRLDSALLADKPKTLVIDVRHNNGGNADLLQPLVDVIKKYEKSDVTNKILVITGRNTFSAAQIFITMVNRDTKALFVGEPSSSKPNFVGEGNYIRLPWSGAMGSISNRYHETIPGDTRKWIQPEYPITLSSAEYFANEDPVMDFVFKKF